MSALIHGCGRNWGICLKARWAVALAAVCLCAVAAGDQPEDYELNMAYDKLPGTVVTPHIAWAKPYYRQTLKTLVIAPTWSQRETVELSQRADISYHPLMTRDFDEMCGQERAAVLATPEVIEAMARQRLAEKYDVILIGKLSWEIFSAEQKAAILGRVREGTGLVFVEPRKCGEIDAVFTHKPLDDERSYIVSGVPTAVLPVLSEVSFKDLIGLSEYGKGRVVRIAYGQSRGSPYLCLTPYVEGRQDAFVYDYYHSLLAKAVLWASRKEPDIYITSMEAMGEASNPRALRVGLWTENQKARQLDVALVVRDRDNQVEHAADTRLNVNPGQQELTLALPALKGGLHLADLWLKEDGKVVNWGSTPLTVRARCGIEKIVLDKAAYQAGETLHGTAFIEAAETAGLSLTAQLWDNYGRLIDEKQIAPKGAQTAFSFEIKWPLSVLMSVKCVLRDQQQVLSEGSALLVVAAQRKKDDYFFVMWADYGRRDYLANLIVRQFREFGVDAEFPTVQSLLLSSADANPSVRGNLQIVPYLFGTFNSWGSAEQREGNIRNPCLTDPQYRAELVETIRTVVPLHRDIGAPAYNLTIQGALTRRAQEFCYCPRCTNVFQEYLKKLYGSLAELNKEWDANYSSWEQIQPITLEEAHKEHKHAQWADFRMCMEEVFTELNVFCKTEIRKIDPEATVGFNEPQSATSFRGMDWSQLLSRLDMCGLYLMREMGHTDMPVEIVRSLMKQPRRDTISGGWIGRYGLNEHFNRAMPWRILFHGGQSIWYWLGFCPDGVGGASALTPDLAPLPYFVQATDEIGEIKRGIGKLLLDSRRENDAIAIYYSPASVHAATLAKIAGDQVESQKAFIHAIEDLGLQYDVISDAQVEEGLLEQGQYKVLVLPHVLAMSPAEVAKIRQFVERGGALLADVNPAVADKHCKPLAASPLEDLFGGFGPGPKTHHAGQGQAVYFDRFLMDYLALRAKGEETPIQQKLGEILASAGVKPRVSISTAAGRNPEATEVVVFRNGDIEYVCFLRDYFSVKDLSPKEATVAFPRRAHVYDARTGQYHGEVQEIKTSIAPARAKVFALVPYRINGVAVRLDKSAYRRGGALSFEVDVETSSGKPSLHCFRIEVVDPDGRVLKHYCQNLLGKDGVCRGSINLSLNEKQGPWKLTARDVVSGATGTGEFSVE